MKKVSILILSLMFLIGCGAGNTIQDRIAEINGCNFKTVKIYGSVPLYLDSTFIAQGGHEEDKKCIIDFISYDIDTPLFDAHYLFEGYEK